MPAAATVSPRSDTATDMPKDPVTSIEFSGQSIVALNEHVLCVPLRQRQTKTLPVVSDGSISWPAASVKRTPASSSDTPSLSSATATAA